MGSGFDHCPCFFHLQRVRAFARYCVSHGEVSEMAEGARLEIVCTLTRYREFESLPLRQIIPAAGMQRGSRAAVTLPTPPGPKGSNGNSCCRVSGSLKAQERSCAFIAYYASSKSERPTLSGASASLSGWRVVQYTAAVTPQGHSSPASLSRTPEPARTVPHAIDVGGIRRGQRIAAHLRTSGELAPQQGS